MKTTNKPIKSPISYPGGKSMIAAIIWDHLDPTSDNYAELCAGTAAVLRWRPIVDPSHYEIINDADCTIINLWRTLAYGDIKKFAELCRAPKAEIHILASHYEEIQERAALTKKMRESTHTFDLPAAVRTLWGRRSWIAFGFGDPAGSNAAKKFPQPGVNFWQRPDFIIELERVRDRFSSVAMFCGGWDRAVASKTLIERRGEFAIFIDPPYYKEGRSGKMYAHEGGIVAYQTRQWALANGHHPQVRIAYAGYYRDHYEIFKAAGWTCVRWKSSGGFGNQGNGQGRINSKDEAIFFSPHCRKPSTSK